MSFVSIPAQLTFGACVLGHATSFVGLFFVSSTYRRLHIVDKYDWSNLVASSIFQLWVVGSMIPVFSHTIDPSYPSHLVTAELTWYYQVLQGYFIYDFLYLFTYGTKYTAFLLHHMSCLYFSVFYLTYGFSTPWFNVLVPILGECTNPFLSMRRILKCTHGKPSAIYQLNRGILLTLYFVCRIVGFPLTLIVLYPEVMNEPASSWLPAYIIIGAVYLVSIGWFARLLRS
jgi:hypothetical protein